MTTIEQIALERLKRELDQIVENVSEVNKDRQEHVRISTKGCVGRALDIVQAIFDNEKNRKS